MMIVRRQADIFRFSCDTLCTGEAQWSTYGLCT